MKALYALLFIVGLLASCNKASEPETNLTDIRQLMPRQAIPVWPAGSIKDTCIEISGNLITGSIAIKEDQSGTYYSFRSFESSHNIYDRMGFETDRLTSGGFHYAYVYQYDTTRRLLYKIGERSRKGVIYRDTTITAYIGNYRTYTVSRDHNGILTIITSSYNSRGKLVLEYNEFYSLNLLPAPTGDRQHYINQFYYSGDKIDSLVTSYPNGQSPFRKLKLVYDAKGLPQKALIERDSVYSVFVVAPCKDSTIFRGH